MSFTKVESDNIYLRFMQETDMPTLATSLVGVHLGDATPDENDQKFFYYQSKTQNDLLFDKRVLQEGDVGWLNFTICSKSDDSIIGWCQQQYRGTEVHQKMAAIIPEQRRKHYYTESAVLRHRFFFDTLGATSVTGIIPTADSDTKTSVRQTLDSLYQTNVKVYNIQQGEYRVSIITKTEWEAWLNHSDRASKKALTYNLTWT